MEDKAPPFDPKALEAMNEKVLKNQFFTPDQIYLDLSLLKDFPIGVIYAHLVMIEPDQEKFEKVQAKILEKTRDYQKRTYDTVDPYFSDIGYNDAKLDALMSLKQYHDMMFLMSPATKFFETLIRHTVRNQNNSRPANKYIKKMIANDQYIPEAIPVTYWINTHPLSISPKVLARVGEELGEAFGVNIRFMNKNPVEFDETDWKGWMGDIDCFYLNNLGNFTRSPFVLQKQGELAFVGRYFFARKRFEKIVMQDMQGADFEQDIQILTARMDMFCDFSWLQNNDVRLTEEKEDVPMDIPPKSEKSETQS